MVLGLAVLFHWSFMFAKHNPALRDVIPFGVDPYDAVGSFGIVIGDLIALLSLIRAFRPFPADAPTPTQRVYLARTQTAVVLAVFITIGSDAIAMVRHALAWLNAPSRNELIALLGGLIAAAMSVQFLIRAVSRPLPGGDSQSWQRALAAVLIAILILLFYPERLVHYPATHLLTILIASCVVFAPMRMLLVALVPYHPREVGEATARNQSWNVSRRWSVVLVIGLLFGASAFVGEMSEGGPALPVSRLLFVASVFTGLGTAGILLAYAFLGTPLGLGRRS